MVSRFCRMVAFIWLDLSQDLDWAPVHFMFSIWKLSLCIDLCYPIGILWFFSFLVSHIVLLVDGPHLKSVTLVTLEAVKLERNNVIVLFPALGGPMGDLVVLEDMVVDLVLEDPVRSAKGNGVWFAGEFSPSHPVLVVVNALGPL